MAEKVYYEKQKKSLSGQRKYELYTLIDGVEVLVPASFFAEGEHGRCYKLVESKKIVKLFKPDRVLVVGDKQHFQELSIAKSIRFMKPLELSHDQNREFNGYESTFVEDDVLTNLPLNTSLEELQEAVYDMYPEIRDLIAQGIFPNDVNEGNIFFGSDIIHGYKIADMDLYSTRSICVSKGHFEKLKQQSGVKKFNRGLLHGITGISWYDEVAEGYLEDLVKWFALKNYTAIIEGENDDINDLLEEFKIALSNYTGKDITTLGDFRKGVKKATKKIR